LIDSFEFLLYPSESKLIAVPGIGRHLDGRAGELHRPCLRWQLVTPPEEFVQR
jgi:hypothetical protein